MKLLLYKDGKTKVELYEQNDKNIKLRFNGIEYIAQTSCIGKELHYIDFCKRCHREVSTPICQKCNSCGTNICNNCRSCQSEECQYFNNGINAKGIDRNGLHQKEKTAPKPKKQSSHNTIIDPLGLYEGISTILEDEKILIEDSGYHTKGGGYGPDDFEEGTMRPGYVRDDEYPPIIK